MDYQIVLDWLFRIVAVIAPIVSSLLTLVFSRKQFTQQLGADFMRDAFQNLYLPFFKLYNGAMLADHPFSQYPLEAQGAFIDIVSHNSVYLSKNSFHIATQLTSHWLTFLDDPSNEEAKNNLDQAFAKIAECLIEDRAGFVRKMNVFR